MATLPTRDNLGPLPSARSGRPIARVDASAELAGQANFGRAVASLGAQLQQSADQADEFETERRFQEFKFEQHKGLQESMRSIEPGQAAGFADRVTKDYFERAKEFKATVPDRLKNQYDAKLFGVERDLYGQSNNFALGEQRRFSVNALEDHKNRLATQADLDGARRDYDDLLKRNPHLTPIEKDELRRKHLDDLDEQHAEGRISRGDYDVLKDLENTHGARTETEAPKSSVGTGTLPVGGSMAGKSWSDVPRSGGAPESREHGGPRKGGRHAGIDIPGKKGDPVVARDGGTVLFVGSGQGYGNMVDVQFPDGTVHRFAHMDSVAGGLKAGQKIEAGSVVGSLGHTGNAGPEFPHLHLEVFPDEKTYSSAKGQSSRASWNLRIDPRRYYEGGPSVEPATAVAAAPPVAQRGITQHAGLVDVERGGALSDATPEGTGAKLPGKYLNLSPKRRAALIYKAKTAQSWTSQQDVLDDIERIRDTGQPKVGADGTTSLQRAERVLGKNQIDRFASKWKEAEAEYKAVSPLKDMSEDEALKHLSDLIPDAGAEGSDSYKIADRAHGKAEAAWKKIKEARLKDPAGSVAKSPEVMQAAERIRAVNPEVSLAQDENGELVLSTRDGSVPPTRATEIMLDARMEAQARMGIPSYQRKVLTKREAEQLLDMPADQGLLSERDFTRKLRAAADRSEQMYGPQYGRPAFESAVALHIKGKEHREEAAGLITKMIKGEAVKQRDFENMMILEQIDQIGRVFDVQRPLDEARPAIFSAEPAPQSFPKGGGFKVQEQMAKKPNDAQVEWVAQDPEARQPIFDLEFGRGAYARAVEALKKKKK